MSEKLMFLKSNQFVPTGRVFSTARKGDKWSKLVKPGDIVDLTVTETGEVFGRAAVTAVMLCNYADVLDDADSNCCAFGPKCQTPGGIPRLVLGQELRDAYGPNKGADVYTNVYLVRLNEEPSSLTPEEVEDSRGMIMELQALGIAGQLLNKDESQPFVVAVSFLQRVGDIETVHRVEF